MSHRATKCNFWVANAQIELGDLVAVVHGRAARELLHQVVHAAFLLQLLAQCEAALERLQVALIAVGAAVVVVHGLFPLGA